LRARGVIAAEELASTKDGSRVRVAGLVLVRQRPGTASGVIFMTLEDETHIANIVVWPKTFERHRAEVLGARLCAVDGMVQSERGVVHVVAERIHDFSPLLANLSAAPLEETLARADETRKASPDPRTHPRKIRHQLAASVMPTGRNFH
jgi:error-prone DNA polymerase